MQFTLGSKFRSYKWSKTSSSRFRVIIAAVATILLLPVGFAPAQAEDGEAVSPEGRSSAVNEIGDLLGPDFQELSDPSNNDPDGGSS
ncbi:MAG TPA: hypothetical protein VLZ31_06280, partial [Microbacteriaceae bacterium]|nr:hypothetical protein [Microbacteriaceae bacterium]